MKKKKGCILLLMALFCCILFTTSAQAAVRKNRFVKSSYGNVYYYNAQGKRVKGLVTIRGRKYYFDSEAFRGSSLALYQRKILLLPPDKRRWCIYAEIYESKFYQFEEKWKCILQQSAAPKT